MSDTGSSRALWAAAVACVAVLGAGVAGALTVSPRAASQTPPTAGAVHAFVRRPSPPSRPSRRSPPAAARSTTTTTTLPPLGPTSSTLVADLLEPSDEANGFYMSEPDLAAADLAASPCMETLERQPGQTGTAINYLRGPNRDGLPGIAEFLASYRPGAAGAAYRAAAADLSRCAALTTALAGDGTAATRLAPLAVPALGAGSVAARGAFTADGEAQTLTIAVVDRDPVVMVMVYVDTQPPANPLYDNFASALTTAFGKLA